MNPPTTVPAPTLASDAEGTAPFGMIALSLSGGGGRAVGFHLGTFDYLHRSGLLTDVSILSTVSGGSFIGISYALYQKLGRTFDEFFVDVYRFLANNQLVLDCLQDLTAEPARTPSGRRTAVTAVANFYHDGFFERNRFGVFWEAEPSIHLKDVIFNATEFKTGRAFRFQKSDTTCYIGNGKVSITDEEARQVRLGDIMAASSCIPGGFEPLFFPKDFEWGPGERGAAVCRRIEERFRETINGEEAIALMDGGVYDNQGIESVLLALARRRFQDDEEEARLAKHQVLTPRVMGTWLNNLVAGRSREGYGVEHGGQAMDCPKCGAALVTGPYHGLEVDRCSQCAGIWFDAGEAERLLDEDTQLGLFIISDTPQFSEAPYYPERPPASPGRVTLGWLNVLAIVIVFAAGATMAFTGLHVTDGIRKNEFSFGSPDDLFSFVVPMLFALGVGSAVIWMRRSVLGVINGIDDLINANRRGDPVRSWSYLRRLPLGTFWEMIALRTTSTFTLVNDIFMDRIRHLGYGQLFAQRRFKKKIMTQEIYDLLVEDDAERRLPAWLKPSDGVLDVVRQSATMGTKLWFKSRDELDRLVVCGQVTMCYNILAHIEWHHRDAEGGIATAEVERLYTATRRDWDRLQTDPYSILHERRAEREAMPGHPKPGASPR